MCVFYTCVCMCERERERERESAVAVSPAGLFDSSRELPGLATVTAWGTA